MGLFTRTEQRESTLQRLHQAISIAFEHVKNDINNLSEWNRYFDNRILDTDERLTMVESANHFSDEKIRAIEKKSRESNERLARIESRLSLLNQQLSSLPKSSDEIKRLIDDHYSYSGVLQKIEALNQRLDVLERGRSERKINIRERIVQRITRNSKDYVKSVILSIVRKYGSISGPQLKEMVVFEQGLCSKSSFYRLLGELEHLSEIEVVQRGKEKDYLAKSSVLKH